MIDADPERFVLHLGQVMDALERWQFATEAAALEVLEPHRLPVPTLIAADLDGSRWTRRRAGPAPSADRWRRCMPSCSVRPTLFLGATARSTASASTTSRSRTTPWVQSYRGQGRADPDAATMRARRDAFVEEALRKHRELA